MDAKPGLTVASPDSYEAKARAELEAADAELTPVPQVMWRGALLAEIAAVKGDPGPSDIAESSALAGEDGIALTKALEALGRGDAAVFATASRPWASQTLQESRGPGSIAYRLACQLEAVDPDVIIALDRHAADDVAAALDIPALAFGTVVEVHGRSVVAVDGLEASLTDSARKSRVWRQLKALGRP